ncbi:MAG: HNH endonuclease [Bacilli bacterium]|nr:HNH endonuclease [Bacilli bacterium]
MRHIYTDEEDLFLKENVKGISLKELTRKFNKMFNLNLSENAIANRKNKLHIFSGIKGGQFKKGHISFNKGKKQTEYMSLEAIERTKATRFKKGNIPCNHRKIGSERISKDGYIEIKIQDGKLNKNWILKHRYIYEQNFGKIPDGYNVIFLDGNKQNFELSNLKLVTKSEDLIMNKNKLFTKNKDLTSVGLNIAKVIDKTQKVRRINVQSKNI